MRMSGFYITRGAGFHVIFENGWTVSVQFGPSHYCENHDMAIGTEDREAGRRGSMDAEVAAWKDGGGLIDLGGDTVRGWQRPKDVLALMVAAANGDLEAGKVPPPTERT